MKVSIGVLVLFLVTKQIVSESPESGLDKGNKGNSEMSPGNSTASNKTISPTTAKPLFKKTTVVSKGISNAEKKNASFVKEDNFTLTTSTESSTLNTTKEHLATNSSAGTTATTGTTKPSATTRNTTKGKVSTTNMEGDEVKKTTSALKESTTNFESVTSKATQGQGYSSGNTVVGENAVVTTAAPEERDLQGGGDDASSTHDRDIIDANSTLPEDIETDNDTGPVSDDENDLTSPKEVENADLEHQTDNDTEGTDSVSVLDPQQHQGNCADYIKKLLSKTLTKHADRLDPLLLRDRKMSFEIPFFLSSVDGHLGFYDGNLTGISRGSPFNECKLEMVGSEVRLVSGIYIDEALIKYKGKATFLDFGPQITIDGKLSGITADLSIIVPKDGGVGRIETLRVRRIERTVIDVKGLGAIDWAVELINEETTKLFSFTFRRSIERDLRKAMEEEIGKISYP